MELPYLLGPTNPCPIAVYMEPFPTLVFKAFIWKFAATTKIALVTVTVLCNEFLYKVFIILYTEDSNMHHYVGFLQIKSQL